MTTDQQRDIVLNFFKERGQEMKIYKSKYTDGDYYLFSNEYVEIDLQSNDYEGWELREISIEIRRELVYAINNLPFDHKELTVLLNILNPLPVC